LNKDFVFNFLSNTQVNIFYFLNKISTLFSLLLKSRKR